MKNRGVRNMLLMLILCLAAQHVHAQQVPQGINYQGIARSTSGILLSSQNIGVKIGIYTPAVTGTLVWEELHAINTNQYGLFSFAMGTGTSTGMGFYASFNQLNWGSADHLVVVSLDVTGGTSYAPVDTIKFWSVPYAFYAQRAATTSQVFSLNDLIDVDTAGIATGYVLKWNGTQWIPAPDLDSDTAVFANTSAHATTADTATVAIGLIDPIDSVLHSMYADTATYALNAANAVNAQHATYTDTAAYAYNTGSTYMYWNLTGNSGTNPSTNFLGTTDNVDLVFETNSIERVRLTTTGRMGIGTATPTATLHTTGIDGLLANATFGSGTALSLGAGTRMHWYPRKAAFRAGGVTTTQWNDASIGNYSFACGNNNIASGAHTFSAGQSNTASGIYSMAVGYGCIGNGHGAIAMGSACNANGAYSIALARGCVASDSGSIAIGYHSNAPGKYAMAFGSYTNASGRNSTTMGWYASSNSRTGSFVYADASSTTVTNSTADNQFMVRASGGVIFYSDAAMTTGVTLASGSGSWASVSDRNKKERFKRVNTADVLSKIMLLDVTTWNYKSQSATIRHIGPMAQDFYKAFQLGENDTTINVVDADGVNLAAIQELAKKTQQLEEKSKEVAELKAKLEALEKEKQKMEGRVILMEQKLGLNQSTSSNNKNGF